MINIFHAFFCLVGVAQRGGCVFVAGGDVGFLRVKVSIFTYIEVQALTLNRSTSDLSLPHCHFCTYSIYVNNRHSCFVCQVVLQHMNMLYSIA